MHRTRPPHLQAGLPNRIACALRCRVSDAGPYRSASAGQPLGGVRERPNRHAWKACVGTAHRGFESLSLRHTGSRHFLHSQERPGICWLSRVLSAIRVAHTSSRRTRMVGVRYPSTRRTHQIECWRSTPENWVRANPCVRSVAPDRMCVDALRSRKAIERGWCVLWLVVGEEVPAGVAARSRLGRVHRCRVPGLVATPWCLDVVAGLRRRRHRGGHCNPRVEE